MSVTLIVPGETYNDARVDIQLPRSHVAFRVPPGFSGRLAPDGTFKMFSPNRDISCFLFVHGAGTALPADWLSGEFPLEGNPIIPIGEPKHFQSDTRYRVFEGAGIQAYRFAKTNPRGAGVHGSTAAPRSEADRLSAFCSAFLASLHRGDPASLPAPVPRPLPAPPPPPATRPVPPPPPPVVPPRDRRLVGLWSYALPRLVSGSSSMVSFRLRCFFADGHFAQGSESFATFVRSESGGQWAGMDTIRSRVPPGERGTWETSRDVLTLHFDDDMYSEFRYFVEGSSMTLRQEGRQLQLWNRS